MIGALPHTPVMLERSLEFLRPAPGTWILDATFGAGGHSRALLEAGASVLAIDRDLTRHDDLAVGHGQRFCFRRGDFRDLEAHAADAGIDQLDGALFDLGVSSMQLDTPERGFAFRHDGPLDMRMGAEGPTAADLVARLSEDDLADLLWRYGEERYSRRIARRIVQEREREPIETTVRLVRLVQDAYPPGRRRDHPARRTFQALRIAVNDELMALREGLEAAARLLAPGGRLVVISYHSLEDRIAKRFIRGRPDLVNLTRKPLTADPAEVQRNPRSRSAKLRAAEKVAP